MIAVLILLVGALVAIGLWSWLAQRAGAHGPDRSGRRASGRDGGGAFGLRSARAIVEQREELEAEDLAQMLEAHNAWRRRRGRPERTVEDVELLVAQEAHEARRRQEAESVDEELDQLIEATNARRRARGLPERDPEEVRRSSGQGEAG